MKKVTVSAPGKLMLLGEHAVVYGYQCLVTAVNQRIFVRLEPTDSMFVVSSPDIGVSIYKKEMKDLGKGEIPKNVQFVEKAVQIISKKYPQTGGLHITIKSDFSSRLGFGSSSAVSVAVIKAVTRLFDISLSQQELFDISYKTILAIQKKGSGFDVAAAIYGGTVFFVSGGKRIEQLKVNPLPLLVGYSGHKADTVSLMNEVNKKWKNDKNGLGKIYKQIAMLVDNAKIALQEDDLLQLGKLMSQNQTLLVELGVSTGKLDAMVKSARDAGAYGAKLSGAGGGDCMIALAGASEKKKVTSAIKHAGGEIIAVRTHAEGVRVEV